METIFKIIGSVCITTYILGLLSNLVDMNYTHRAVKLTFALYFLTAVLLPSKEIKFNIPKLDDVTYSTQTDAQEYVFTLASQQMEEDIKQILTSQDIDYSEVYVHINKEGSGTYIDYIKIIGVDEPKHKYVESNLNGYGKIIFGE